MKKKLLTLMLSLVLATAPTMKLLAEEVTPTAPTESVEEVTETTDETTEDTTNQQTKQDAVEEAKDVLADVAEGVAVETDDQIADEKQSELDELKKKTEDELLEEEAEEDTEDEESEEDEIVFEDTMSQDAMNAGNSGNFSSLDSSVTWSISGTTLTIGGTGAMPRYNNGIGDWAAYNSACTTNTIRTIKVNSGVTEIAAYAFSSDRSASFSNVTSVTLPSTLTDIGAFAFKGNTALTEISISSASGVNVHESAFINCSNLSTVTLGTGVKEVGVSAFEGCNKISRVNTSSLAAWCGIYFGGIKSNPTEVSHNLYVGGTQLTNLVVPSGIQEISPFAFQGITSISQVTIPASVATIGEYAFHGCTGMQYLTINGAGLKTIGAYAFEALHVDGQTTGVKDLSLPASVQYIGEYAFQGSGLETVQVPSGFIGNYAFRWTGLMFANLGPAVVVAPHAFDGISTEVLRHDISASSYSVPNTVNFGGYRWKVLTVSGNEALLLSEEVLSYRRFYDSENQDGKWVNSDIRTYLNGTFYNSIPSSARGSIKQKTISDSTNSKYGTKIGTTTTDYVFLLSEEELNTYLPRADLRVAPASAAAKASNTNPGRYNGSRVDESAYYWVRTPGISAEYSEYVTYNGNFSYDGAYTSNPQIFGVRPAIWVDKSVLNGISATTTVAFPGVTSTFWRKDIYAFVQRLYALALGRTPDFVGWQDWEYQLENGFADGANVALGFFISTEMMNRHLSNEEYVEILYNVMMNRGSDPVGKAGWVEALDSGVSYAAVVKGFAESQEYTQICESYHIHRGNITVTEPLDVNIGVTKFVARCYTKTLGRKYEEDGLRNWVNYINNTPNPRESAIMVSANEFFHSQEFLNKNLNDGDYVDVLYRTFLGRECDAAGKADWTSQLKSGKTRDEVMAGFYNSKEYDDIMRSYGL